MNFSLTQLSCCTYVGAQVSKSQGVLWTRAPLQVQLLPSRTEFCFWEVGSSPCRMSWPNLKSLTWIMDLTDTENQRTWINHICIPKSAKQWIIEYYFKLLSFEVICYYLCQTYCCGKAPWPEAWEERADVSLQLSGDPPSLREVRAGAQGRNQWQALNQRLWRHIAYCLATHCLFNLISFFFFRSFVFILHTNHITPSLPSSCSPPAFILAGFFLMDSWELP